MTLIQRHIGAAGVAAAVWALAAIAFASSIPGQFIGEPLNLPDLNKPQKNSTGWRGTQFTVTQDGYQVTHIGLLDVFNDSNCLSPWAELTSAQRAGDAALPDGTTPENAGDGVGDGTIAEHAVALCEITGFKPPFGGAYSLLATGTIVAGAKGSASDGYWAWAALSKPVVLKAGRTYVAYSANAWVNNGPLQQGDFTWGDSPMLANDAVGGPFKDVGFRAVFEPGLPPNGSNSEWGMPGIADGTRFYRLQK